MSGEHKIPSTEHHTGDNSLTGGDATNFDNLPGGLTIDDLAEIITVAVSESLDGMRKSLDDMLDIHTERVVAIIDRGFQRIGNNLLQEEGFPVILRPRSHAVVRARSSGSVSGDVYEVVRFLR